jgi:hypothetical protein
MRDVHLGTGLTSFEVNPQPHSAEELLRLQEEIDALRPVDFGRLMIRGTSALVVGAAALVLGVLYLPDGFQGRSLGEVGLALTVSGAVLAGIGGFELTKTLRRIKTFRGLKGRLETWPDGELSRGRGADGRNVPSG